MFFQPRSLLVLLLASTLVLVQTALPWLHIGCEHDHWAIQASDTQAGDTQASASHVHGAGPCRHHSHAAKSQATTPGPIVEHRHEHVSAADCAACRLSLLSSLVAAQSESPRCEHFSEVSSPRPIGAAVHRPAGSFRPRAPPALS